MIIENKLLRIVSTKEFLERFRSYEQESINALVEFLSKPEFSENVIDDLLQNFEEYNNLNKILKKFRKRLHKARRKNIRRSYIFNYLRNFEKKHSLPKEIKTLITEGKRAKNTASVIINNLNQYYRKNRWKKVFYIIIKKNQSADLGTIYEELSTLFLRGKFVEMAFERHRRESKKDLIQKIESLHHDFSVISSFITLLSNPKFSSKDVLDVLGAHYITSDKENINQLKWEIIDVIEPLLKEKLQNYERKEISTSIFNSIIDRLENYCDKEICKDFGLITYIKKEQLILQKSRNPSYALHYSYVKRFIREHSDWERYIPELTTYCEENMRGIPSEFVELFFFSEFNYLLEMIEGKYTDGIIASIKRMERMRNRYSGYKFYKKLDHIKKKYPWLRFS